MFHESHTPSISGTVRTDTDHLLSPDADPPWWAWLFVVSMMLASAAIGPLGAPYLDAIRDLYWAQQIATATQWPLVGPEIGFFTHIGPAWYYLLSPPLIFNGGLVSAAAWAGLLQGAQFPLALAFGRQIGQWRFGLFLAALLALPGLTTFTYLSFNHFNLVPAAMIGLAMIAWSDWERPRRGSALGLGLVFSLLIHAHPANLALGWILPVLWLAAPDRIVRAGLLLAGLLLPLLPLLLAGLLGAVPDTPTTGLSGHLREHWNPAAIGQTPVLFWHVIVEGFRHGLLLSTDAVPGARVALRIAVVALVVLALSGLPATLRPGYLRRLAAVALLALIIQTAAALWMRSQTLWYMMLAAPTLTALVLAAGLTAIRPRPRNRMILPLALVTGLAAMALLTTSLLATKDNSGNRHFPAAFMLDLLSSPEVSATSAGAQLSFLGSATMAHRLCATEQAIVVHAGLAQIVDSLTDLVFWLECPGHTPKVRIAGMDPTAEHLLAVGPGVADALPLVPDGRLEATIFYPVARVVHPPNSVALASAGNYPPRPRNPERVPGIVDFQTRAGDWLLISNPYAWWTTIDIAAVIANGRALTPTAFDFVTSVFHCNHCAAGQPVSWRVRFDAPSAMQPDIVVVEGTHSRTD